MEETEARKVGRVLSATVGGAAVVALKAPVTETEAATVDAMAWVAKERAVSSVAGSVAEERAAGEKRAEAQKAGGGKVEAVLAA